MNMDKFNKLRGVFCQLKASWAPFKLKMCVQEFQFLLVKIWSHSVTSPVLLSTELWASWVCLPFSELTPLSNLSTVLQSENSWVSLFVLCGFFFSLLRMYSFTALIYLSINVFFFKLMYQSGQCPVARDIVWPNLEVEYSLLGRSVLNDAIALKRNGCLSCCTLCVWVLVSVMKLREQHTWSNWSKD